ncbi:hypothetical protein H8356DRAFT_1320141 [Neocallimastix lanati (nom. inval.)]|nr:hypothetical protein H8356DRAFT_1320141 [Neocallimastix sp. JGI-2020a]
MSNDDYNSTENQQSRNLPVQKKGNPTTNEESVEKVPVEKVLSELKKELVLEDKPTEKQYINIINPTTGEKEVVEELGDETPFEPDDINRMSRRELRNFTREQPLRLIESIRFEAVTRIIPLINEYEKRVKTQPRSELEIMFRKIMEFLAQKIILLDKIDSEDKEILRERKSLIKYLQSLERRTEEI